MPDLIQAAREVREHAYAPYSAYKVGAAILDTAGRVWVGCNLENVSYPLCVCAERNAVAQMIGSGGGDIAEVAVVTKDGGFPCGGCLQVLLEFSPDPSLVKVSAVAESGEARTHTLHELLPHGFRSPYVSRTEL
jgi:cytidine deaminase